jgi:hypothetical protein
VGGAGTSSAAHWAVFIAPIVTLLPSVTVVVHDRNVT